MQHARQNGTCWRTRCAEVCTAGRESGCQQMRMPVWHKAGRWRGFAGLPAGPDRDFLIWDTGCGILVVNAFLNILGSCNKSRKLLSAFEKDCDHVAFVIWSPCIIQEIIEVAQQFIQSWSVVRKYSARAGIRDKNGPICCPCASRGCYPAAKAEDRFRTNLCAVAHLEGLSRNLIYVCSNAAVNTKAVLWKSGEECWH